MVGAAPIRTDAGRRQLRGDLSYLGAVALLAAAYASYMLGGISARLGAVTGMPPRYRIAYWGAGLLAWSGVARLLLDLGRAGTMLRLVVYDLPLVVGSIAVLIVALVYWGWLVHAK